MSKQTIVIAFFYACSVLAGCGGGGGGDGSSAEDAVVAADLSENDDPDRAPLNPIDSQDGIINTAQNPDAQVITGDGFVLTVHDPLTSIRNQGAFGSPIRCRSGSYKLDAPGRDLVIDGQGRGPCVRVERGCVTEVNARSITLNNCRVCTEASRSSTLNLNATNGSVNCSSTRHAVDLKTASSLNIASTSEITIRSAQRTSAVRARSGSTVRLRAPGVCHVLGERGPLESDSTSRMDTAGCGQFDQGVVTPTPTPGTTPPTPTPRPTTPTPAPSNAGQCREGMLLHTTGHPHHHGDGHGGCIVGNRTVTATTSSTSSTVTTYFSEPIFCSDQELTFDDPSADLVIKGDGSSPCITASDSCSAEIRAKSITFANCGTCVEATESSNVTLSALGGDILCASAGSRMQSDESSDISLNDEK